MAGGRILVVDDDNVLRASISRILEEEGYVVDSAPDGESALDKVKADPPDAILLDVMMPGMNGRQFLDQLRSDALEIPVVVMTALQGLGTSRVIEYGANDFVEKPFDVDELLNKVALALFRSGEYDTLHDRPPVPRAGASPPPPTEDTSASGIVLVVDEDQDALGYVDSLLDAQGYTVVSLSRVTDELTRLARVLEPRGIVLGLRDGSVALEALRRVRADRALDAVPVLVFTDDAARIEPHRDEIDALGAAVNGQLAKDDLLSFLRQPPAGARRAQPQ